MTPETWDKCGSLQIPALIILAKMLLTRRQHHKTGQSLSSPAAQRRRCRLALRASDASSELLQILPG
ncbi:hypothetical protein NQZ68_037759 [Dissostichus eleginoides]|nr:hypothetical protein NQZ68_037759 [Dissostichus eleginoides]